MKVIEVPKASLEKVERKLERICAKAEKIGRVLSFTFGKPYVKDIELEDENGTVTQKKIEVVKIEIEGDVNFSTDYEAIAMLEHCKNAMTVVHSLTEECYKRPEFKGWALLGGNCEHCNTKHFRKWTYIVRNVKTDKLAQVGSSCLQDFTGISLEATEILESVESMSLKKKYVGAEVEAVKNLPTAYITYEVIAAVCALLDGSGVWVNSMDIKKVVEEEREKMNLEESDKILNYASTEMEGTNPNPYVRRCNDFIECGLVTLEDSGALISLVGAFRRDKAYQEKREAKRKELESLAKSSEYVGEIKERRIFEIQSWKVLSSWETLYGTQSLYRFVDVDGNVLVWFTTSAYNPVVGSTRIVATVREHQEYNGVKQTVISRVRETY